MAKKPYLLKRESGASPGWEVGDRNHRILGTVREYRNLYLRRPDGSRYPDVNDGTWVALLTGRDKDEKLIIIPVFGFKTREEAAQAVYDARTVE